MLKIFATSDTHGDLNWKVPQCDLLLHAGDICPDGYRNLWCRKDLGRSMLWLREKFVPFLTPYLESGWVKQVIMTLGNHDWISKLEVERFNEDFPQIQILIDGQTSYGGLSIYGIPWSNQFMNWAWMKEPAELAPYYEAIPSAKECWCCLGKKRCEFPDGEYGPCSECKGKGVLPEIDILISHQPPLGAGSTFFDIWEGKIREVGSEELAQNLERISPKAVICGHIHGGFGVYPFKGTTVYNVAALDEQYKLVNDPVEIIL